MGMKGKKMNDTITKFDDYISFDRVKYGENNFTYSKIFDFRNGYGASVILGESTNNKFELAVFKRIDKTLSYCSSTSLTNDVIRNIDLDQINGLLEKIKRKEFNDNSQLAGIEEITSVTT